MYFLNLGVKGLKFLYTGKMESITLMRGTGKLPCSASSLVSTAVVVGDSHWSWSLMGKRQVWDRNLTFRPMSHESQNDIMCGFGLRRVCASFGTDIETVCLIGICRSFTDEHSQLQDTFEWDSGYWTDKETYEPEARRGGLDKQETKLATYWTTPFTKVCIGMDDAGHKSFKSIDVSADSLHALIAGGKYHQTSLGRDAWKGLLKSGSLQMNCNREGFNAQAHKFKIRIGIISNQENDCKTDDSYIGFGSSGEPSTGNRARWNGHNGKRTTKTFGYILVQYSRRSAVASYEVI